MTDIAPILAPLVRRLLGGALPFALEAWDGSRVEPDEPVGARAATAGDRRPITVVVRSPDALRRILYAPGELGLARAHIAGEIDVDGDIFDLLAVRDVLGGSSDHVRVGPRLTDAAAIARTMREVGALGPPLPPPPEEARARGRRHSRRRDSTAVRHHYDVGNEFYRLVLGEAMTYSCAYWAPGVDSLEAAQAAKHELVCRKLGLTPGMRVLDIGCGWGSFVIHAAKHHGARALGVTLSPEQAARARQRVADEGLEDRVEIRVQDYRDLDEPEFPAIASVGMFEHVGEGQADTYAAAVTRLLAPGGRLLNHAISRANPDDTAGVDDRSFIGRYVFPDAALYEVGQVVTTLQRAGLEVRDVESLREHYARTLRAWVANLQDGWDEAQRLAGPARARTWRLYMAGSAVGFEAGRISVHQVVAVRPQAGGESGFPTTRDWLAEPVTGRV
ncbi:class I SAM-dependent methyltransferase [Iamia sp. SCSIO 61187]|uniref:SAM-dependent methyltransferase n=1 Tax=Iamia sp. SCSIO 61187 TaxID=2722752 RepID=UPI001C62A38E|nr:cyclopropane-fatty-acyl-phospholipid synthase family protein [Iamia sp. SCSIO 61187]QYG93920.1 class I SAM-dependent methyltransferase [Iamia sp. SCSIO 61187]